MVISQSKQISVHIAAPSSSSSSSYIIIIVVNNISSSNAAITQKLLRFQISKPSLQN